VQHFPAIHRTIVAVDMADFTNPARTGQHQLAMRRGLDEALRTAFRKIGVRWNSCHHEDRGDGVLILLPIAFPKAKIFELLPGLLLAALVRHNALHVEAAHIRLRMAVHSGEVFADDNGLVGVAVNDTFRILDSDQAKKDLRQSAGVLGIIVSETIFEQVVKDDPAVEPGTFKQIAVAVKHTRTTAWMRVYGKVVDPSRVLPGFEEAAVAQLRQLVGELIFPELPAVLAHAVGPGVPPLGRKANAWEMVKYVLDLNANPGGFPKLITFVELLADHVGGSLGAALRSWNDTQAGQLRLTAALGELRAETRVPVRVEDRLHLVIVVEHDLFDHDRCLVSHWRQDDPTEWRPARGESRPAGVHDLERVVDDLVVNAEMAWAGLDGDAALEFVLPRALLNLPVDQWCREGRSGDPSLLVLHYRIVVRSLERMLAPYWHRVWRAKWRVLSGTAPNGRVFAPSTAEVDQPHRLAAMLQEREVVSMVLSQPPPAAAGPHDELSAAMRAGLPAVLWSRRTGDQDALADLVAGLTYDRDLARLPDRVHEARLAALRSDDHQEHTDVVQHLVILWDAPVRPVYLDQIPRATRLEGDGTDEPE
jgi:hypothetical protein